MSIFYKRYLELCEKNNVKPREVAKSIGAAPATVTRWKNGSVPSHKTLEQIADKFNVPIVYLSVEDIVLCKECKYYYVNDKNGICIKGNYNFPFPAEGFCSYGERND